MYITGDEIMAKKLLIVLLFILSISVVSATYTDPFKGNDLTVDGFKEQCVDVSFKDLKTDNSLINQSVKLTGKVYMANDKLMLFHMDGDKDQEVLIYFPYDKDNSKFKNFEGVDAIVYCRYDGISYDGLFTGGKPELSIVDIE